MTKPYPMQSSTPDGERFPSVEISELRIEHLRETLGFDKARPRISWITMTNRPAWRQSAYEIEAVYPSTGRQVSTGRVDGDQSVLVDWPFEPLQSRERVDLRVRLWGSDGDSSAWSAPRSVEAGLLHVEDWSARFISPEWDEDTTTSQPAPLLRKEFEVLPGLESARLYITALGVYEAEINGAVVGDHVLDPGWTSYNNRLRYSTFDVTELLIQGPNAIGAVLGDGWYRGRIGFEGLRSFYGNRLALLAQLELTYADHTSQIIQTDTSWRVSTGPMISSDLYDGEQYDARLELHGWSQPGFDDSDWKRVRLIERDLHTLVAPSGPPVRRIQTINPQKISLSPSGKTIIDFGQNLVGRLRIRVEGPSGQQITLRHAEILEEGELCTWPLRTAQATDSYFLRGEGVETWEPRFTFHGFRYAEVSGWPGKLSADAVQAIVLHSDMERTGWFECSDPLLNKLHENIVWGMRGNFLDVPTDCPQRDERLGWTGDLQVFSPAASFLYDTAGLLTSWLADLAVDQRAKDGAVPFVVPDVIPNTPPATAWGDASVVVPWVLYRRFGDAGILGEQFESMRAWVDLIAKLAGPNRLWDSGFQFGDWLDPNAPKDNPGGALTDKYLIASAYFAHSAEIVGQAAEVLGRQEDARHYLDLAEEVRVAWNKAYHPLPEQLTSDTPTAYSLAIAFALLPDDASRFAAGKRLAELVEESGFRISTGFVGTPIICDALCLTGNEETAFRLLMQTEVPSWLYPVTQGATTIWERWDAILPDGSISRSGMLSFNHYALGAVADWIQRVIGGLAPGSPGYRQILFQPLPPPNLKYARASHKTPYGIAECAWNISDGMISIQIQVPPNTTATVILPGGAEEPLEISSGSHRWDYPYIS